MRIVSLNHDFMNSLNKNNVQQIGKGLNKNNNKKE